MKLIYVLVLLPLLLGSCDKNLAKEPLSIDFGTILKPYYKRAAQEQNCEKIESADISVFDKVNHRVSFNYPNCLAGEEQEEIQDFRFKSTHLGYYTDQVVANTKVKLSPAAEKLQRETHINVPVPHFSISDIGNLSLETYLTKQKPLVNVNWSVCKLIEINPSIYELVNPNFIEVPDPNYMLSDYKNFSEYQNKHVKDKAEYKAKYSLQKKKNKACSNHDRYYYFVLSDGILLTIPRSEHLKANSVDPTTIKYNYKP